MDDKDRYACACYIRESVEAFSGSNVLVDVQVLIFEHLTETNVTSKICDMAGETFPVDASIPNSSHGPALDKKQKDLGKMTGRDKSNQDPEEHVELLPCPVDEP